jgi:hypothetical protein
MKKESYIKDLAEYTCSEAIVFLFRTPKKQIKFLRKVKSAVQSDKDNYVHWQKWFKGLTHEQQDSFSCPLILYQTTRYPGDFVAKSLAFHLRDVQDSLIKDYPRLKVLNPGKIYTYWLNKYAKDHPGIFKC